MKSEYLNMFIDATRETLEIMCSINTLSKDGEIRKISGDIIDVDGCMAVCGLTGDVKGLLF